MPGFLRDYFAARQGLGDAADFGDLLGDDAVRDVEPVIKVLRLVDHPSARVLEEQLTAWRARTLNRAFLQSFGRFWTESPAERLLVSPRSLEVALAEAEAGITAPPHRSLVVVAESRVGKSAFLRLLGARLAARGWTVFEAGGAELMAGQSYFGQLEERIKQLTEELAVVKRVVWSVPDFLQLALSGASKSQSASIIDQILPTLSAGRLVVISEASPAALAKLLQARPMLRTAVDVVRLPVLSDAEMHDLIAQFVARLAEHTGLDIDPDVAPAAATLARQHFGTVHLPGAALDLLKHAANQRVANGEMHLTRHDLLGTLSPLSGLPLAILDEGELVDLAEMREFFASSVIGQDEAVGAIVDRIAMLKAGLVDPARPIGVFLFAGPTGTGKTELAKALAAFLFGSPERMVRLDMSEFQTRESTTKILGDGSGSGETVSLIELRAVFERRGLRNRDWAVEWESSALEFLLEQGFSPEMGARPLKRAIDHHLLAPLAATIVEHRFPEGDQFLFVRSDGSMPPPGRAKPRGFRTGPAPTPAGAAASTTFRTDP